MKQNKIIVSILLSISCLFLVLCFTGNVFAAGYSLDFWWVQKRTYENGQTLNRIGFAVREDSSGDYVTTDVIKSLSLTGPSGAITLQERNFSEWNDLDPAQYDPWQGLYNYGTNFVGGAGYTVNFDADLEVGDYTLQVYDTANDIIGTETRTFNGVVELPLISSESFRGSEDSAGNFVWCWNPISDTKFWAMTISKSLGTSLRAYVASSNGAEIYLTLPTTAGCMFVPAASWTAAKQVMDNPFVQIQVRSHDQGNNRIYSNQIAVSALPNLDVINKKSSFFVIPTKRDNTADEPEE